MAMHANDGVRGDLFLHRAAALVILSLALAGMDTPAHAGDFNFTLASPSLAVSVPGTPAMEMGPHPQGGPDRPHLRAFGTSGDFVVSVITPAVEPGMEPRDCAAAFDRRLPDLLARPYMQNINRFRLDDMTYLVYYIGTADLRLHAHLHSAVGGHCVEVHISRGRASRNELMDWLMGLTAARISAPAPAPAQSL